jgi:hypothetical protein
MKTLSRMPGTLLTLTLGYATMVHATSPELLQPYPQHWAKFSISGRGCEQADAGRREEIGQLLQQLKQEQINAHTGRRG